MAAQENRVEIVTYLLENGARANLATEVLLQVFLLMSLMANYS